MDANHHFEGGQGTLDVEESLMECLEGGGHADFFKRYLLTDELPHLHTPSPLQSPTYLPLSMHPCHGSDKIQEMDDLVWTNADTQLNLTHILEPIFKKVRPRP